MSELAEEIFLIMDDLYLEQFVDGGLDRPTELIADGPTRKAKVTALIDEKLSGVLRLVAQMSLSGKAVDSLYESLKVSDD